jgi:hypothetical protein
MSKTHRNHENSNFVFILHYISINCNTRKKQLPPGRIELTTPGLQDLCSATELRRLHLLNVIHSSTLCQTFLYENCLNDFETTIWNAQTVQTKSLKTNNEANYLKQGQIRNQNLSFENNCISSNFSINKINSLNKYVQGSVVVPVITIRRRHRRRRWTSHRLRIRI